MRNYSLADWATQAYLGMVGLLILCFHNHTVSAWPRLVGIHAGLMLAIHALILAADGGWGGEPFRFLRRFYPILLYAWLYGETARLNRMFIPHYLDATMIRWEQAVFGFQPSLVFMQKFPYLPLSEMFYFFYFSYYLMLGGLGLALYWRNQDYFLHYVSVISILFYVCYLLYIFLPVIGPPVFVSHIEGYSLPADLRHLIPATPYPQAVTRGPFFKLMAWIYRGFEEPGAAIPSSHVAVALGSLYFSFRYLRPIRYTHLVAAILLCVATVYCRYHYGLDVLAGILAAALIVPLANRLYFKFASRAATSRAKHNVASPLAQ